jgi:hypothetical protein
MKLFTATLLATTALLLPLGAYAQSCQSEAAMSALASATWNQVMGDDVAECGLNGSGPQQKGLTTGVKCVPITLDSGDVTPTNGLTVTDAQGNTWGLYVPPGEDGNGQWYAGITFNGQPVNDGYFIALRVVGGVVYAEEAKGSGWQIANPQNPGDTGNTWTYVDAPGSSGCDASQAANSTPSAASVADPPAATGSAQSAAAATTVTPDSTNACPIGGLAPNAITPGSGTFTANGSTYSVDATNNNAASVNGQAINGGAYQTAQLVEGNDGNIYGQSGAADNNGQWEMLSADGTYWIPLSGVPTAITSTSGSSPVTSSGTCPSAATASNGTPAASTGVPPGQATGPLPNVLEVCSDPATVSVPTNATLCAQAFQGQAALDQAAAQLAAAQQNTTTTAAPSDNSGGQQ